MTHLEAFIVALKTITMILGGLITYLSWKAHVRTGSSALRALAFGFAIVTAGGILGGVVDMGVSLGYIDASPILWGVAFQSALTALGFGVIVYSLYVE